MPYESVPTTQGLVRCVELARPTIRVRVPRSVFVSFVLQESKNPKSYVDF